MRKINILTKDVYNRIAAGEVVDRPYSAVKELIENSLDAKATEIEIYVEGGGKQLIKVIDNGSGIERDDLRAAFLPHATSKISAAEDLDDILTLGFRGEALASISAISKVELTSVTEGNSAYKITCEGGKIGEIVPAVFEKGTEIIVRDLFYNTPVRAKFMKTDKKEEADITSFVTRYILGNPQVSFKYYTDGKLALQSFGGGLDEAVAQVYGAKVLGECFKLDAERNGVKLRGFIGNQNFFKPTKTYQSVFLNGRYIVNNTIATAISQAYASYAMKRQFPFYVLFIDVPRDIVDVNVHPSKADVRFVDGKFIFGNVYSVISSVLDGTSAAAEFVVNSGSRTAEVKSTFKNAPLNYGDRLKNNATADDYAAKAVGTDSDEKLRKLIEKYKPERKVDTSEAREIAVTAAESEQRDFDILKDLPLDELMPKQKDSVLKVTDDGMAPSFGAAYTSGSIPSKQQAIDYSECKYKGNLFNTYLMYEYGETVYIIDQHAAHERLIFDNLMKKLAERSIVRQPLLIPYIFETNAQEERILEEKLSVLRSMGFGIEPFGVGSYRIDEVPVDLQDINIEEFMGEILADTEGLKDANLENILKEKIATTACKHAVKGGMQLTDGEIDALFKMINGNMGLKCPHGRPVCVALTKRDVEKMFKRIV